LLLADTKRERDFIKERLDIKVAKCAEDMKKNFEKFGYDKQPSETAMNNQKMYMLHPDYEVASEAYIEACYNVGVTQAGEQAMAMKKSMLEELVRLLAMNYHSEPKLDDEETRTKYENNKTAKVSNEINDALNKENKE
jgi:hypothetical protein